jgi:tRNA U55 pseudouridine synthase TruB
VFVRIDEGVGTFRLTCSPGFYVRSFAHTLGQLVGTGACLEALRRTRSGEFGLERAVTVGDLQADPSVVLRRLITLDDLLPDLPSVRLTEDGRRYVTHGREVDDRHVLSETPDGEPVAGGTWEGGPPADAWVRILDRGGRLIAVGRRRAPHGALHPSIVLN